MNWSTGVRGHEDNRHHRRLKPAVPGKALKHVEHAQPELDHLHIHLYQQA